LEQAGADHAIQSAPKDCLEGRFDSVTFLNEVSRMAAMCRSVDQPLLVSSDFAPAVGEARSRLVSVGRYARRGVGRAQDLFTLE
jgi:hypothetical protein